MRRIQQMMRFFDTPAQLGRFLGVSTDTVYAWLSDRRKPTRAALRLMWVMEHLEDYAPELHAALVREVKRNP